MRHRSASGNAPRETSEAGKICGNVANKTLSVKLFTATNLLGRAAEWVQGQVVQMGSEAFNVSQRSADPSLLYLVRTFQTLSLALCGKRTTVRSSHPATQRRCTCLFSAPAGTCGYSTVSTCVHANLVVRREASGQPHLQTQTYRQRPQHPNTRPFSGSLFRYFIFRSPNCVFCCRPAFSRRVCSFYRDAVSYWWAQTPHQSPFSHADARNYEWPFM